MVRCLHPIRVICALIVLTACSTVPQVGAPPTIHAINGMQMTPLDVPSDDMAKILQMDRWKFRIVFPLANGERDAAARESELIKLHYQVELRQRGHDPVVLVEYTIGTSRTLGEPGEEMLVALFPFDKLGTRADQMKLYLDGGVHVIDNPLKGHQGTMVARPAAIQPDGSFLLMEMGTNPVENTFPSPDNRQLVFSLTRVDQP